MSFNLDISDLVTALSVAVVQAQDSVERHSISLLSNFFDRDGRAKMVPVRVPSTRPHAGPDDEEVLQIPLLALVGSNRLAIKELEIEADVMLAQPDGVQHYGLDDDDAREAMAARRYQDLVDEGLGATGRYRGDHPPTVTVDMGSTDSDAASSKARIKLVINSQDTTEGMSRLFVELNKKIFAQNDR